MSALAPLFALLGLAFMQPVLAILPDQPEKQIRPKPAPKPHKSVSDTSDSGTRDDLGVEMMFWDSIKDSNNPADFKVYLDKYPDGKFVLLAKNRLNRLSVHDTGQTANPTGTTSERIEYKGEKNNTKWSGINCRNASCLFCPDGTHSEEFTLKTTGASVNGTLNIDGTLTPVNGTVSNNILQLKSGFGSTHNISINQTNNTAVDNWCNKDGFCEKCELEKQ